MLIGGGFCGKPSGASEGADTVDLTTLVESDGNNRLTVTADKCTITGLQFDEFMYLRSSSYSNSIEDCEVKWDAEITSSDITDSQCIVEMFCICDGTTTPWSRWSNPNNDGIGVWIRSTSGDFEIELRDYEGSAVLDERVLSGQGTMPHYWFTFTRSGTAISLDIHDDSGRTSLVETLSGTADNTEAYSYYFFPSGLGYTSGNDGEMTGYVQNLELVSGF